MGEVDELLASRPEDVRRLALATRARVLGEIPDAVEQVKEGWNAIWYGTGPKMKQQLLVIHLQKDYVNLAFAKGASLPDPDGLLEGTGKSIRHVRIRDVERLASAPLRADPGRRRRRSVTRFRTPEAGPV